MRVSATALTAVLLLFACERDRGALYENLPDGAVAPASIIELHAGLGEDDACAQCMMDSCETAERVCLEDPACEARERCLAACRDPDCDVGCDAEHPEEDVMELVSLCRRDKCTNDCDVTRNWGCAGNFEWSNPQDDALEATITVRNVITNMLEPGIRVTVCGDPLSETCSEDDSAVSDDNGRLTVMLPHPPDAGFAAYLEVTAEGYVPLVQHHISEITHPRPRFSIFVITVEQFEGGARTIDAEYRQDRGAILLSALDCSNDWAPGVAFSLNPMEPEVVQFYGATPTTDATQTSDGRGGFGGVRPGQIEVTATHVQRDETLGRRKIWVRGGWNTGVFLSAPSRGEAEAF